MTRINFDVIWRYFAWANQTLAAVVLWTITVYLLQKKKRYYLITLIPALFMTMVVTTYLMLAPEGFSLSQPLSYGIGLSIVILTLTQFLIFKKKSGQLK
jgi:carbon starvation protein CstA